MKKLFNIFVVLGLMFLLTGCGSDSPVEKFGVDKEINITEELSTEDLETVLSEIENSYVNINQISLKLTAEQNQLDVKQKAEVTMKAHIKEDDVQVVINLKAEQDGVKQIMNLYLKDEVIYIDAKTTDAELKWKLSLAAVMNLIGDEEMDFNDNPEELMATLKEALAELEAELGEALSEASFGKDKNGNLIGEFHIEEDGESANARIVFSEGLLQYAGLKASNGSKIELSVEYKGVDIKFPNFKDYQDMDEFIGQMIG